MKTKLKICKKQDKAIKKFKILKLCSKFQQASKRLKLTQLKA